MRYCLNKKESIYIITRITGNHDNILGICFSKNDSTEIEVIQWNREKEEEIITSKKKVLKQVLAGLESVNQALGTDYRLSKIYYLPSESAENFVYAFLTSLIIRHYHNGKEFEEF